MVGYYSFSYTVSHCTSELFTGLSTSCAGCTPTAETAAVWGSHPSFIRCYSLVAALGVGGWDPEEINICSIDFGVHQGFLSSIYMPGWPADRGTQETLTMLETYLIIFQVNTTDYITGWTDLNFSTLIVLLLKFHRCLFVVFNFQTWLLHYCRYCNGYINSSIKEYVLL